MAIVEPAGHVDFLHKYSEQEKRDFRHKVSHLGILEARGPPTGRRVPFRAIMRMHFGAF